PDDQLGIVLFDNQAHLAKPLRLVGETDMASIKRHVLALRETGNTNVEAGYRMATDLLTGVSSGDPASYENRIIFLTDAQPNSGALDERVLAGLVQSNAGQRIYTTFIGIGVDFNSTLVEGLTKTRGANYYAVHSPLDFVRRLDDEFDFMVTPLLFDLTLTFNSPDYTIAKVYGSPEADAASGELMRINTLFPSASRGGESKGGLVLLQLQPRHGGTNDGGAATLTVTYADRSGNLQSSVATVILPPTNSGQWQDRYDNDGIRKGILLVRYANLLRNWINDSRAIAAGLDDWRYPSVSTERGIVIPTTPNLGQWERQALPLRVAPDYRALFAAFQRYFANEMGAIGDGTLTQEVTVLEKLSNH
ncbi:MAG: VWA domain-containing protein, partial [Caldilineaceae bacterium]|nr:VWA domain-containing protein [Caldilineaceae bacterium]